MKLFSMQFVIPSPNTLALAELNMHDRCVKNVIPYHMLYD